jgi:hypothetical protein
MSPPTTPQAQFTDYAQLASRIARYIAKHPHDAQARDDLRYIVGKMQGLPGGAPGATAQANAADATDLGIGPAATYAQKALEWSPAGALSGIADLATMGPTGRGAPDLLRRGEAAAAGVPYPDFVAMEAAGAKANPAAAKLGAATGAFLVPGVTAAVRTANAARGGLAALLSRLAPAAPKAIAKAAPAAIPKAAASAEDIARAAFLRAGVKPENVDAVVARSLAGSAARSAAPAIANPLDALRSLPDAALGATPPLAESAAAPGLLEQQATRASQGILSKLGTGETLPYYPRGGAAEQAIPPLPTASALPATATVPKQLGLLLGLSPAEFESAASSGMFPRDLIAQVRALRLQGATPGLLLHAVEANPALLRGP